MRFYPHCLKMKQKFTITIRVEIGVETQKRKSQFDVETRDRNTIGVEIRSNVELDHSVGHPGGLLRRETP
jgi:hypothetical protein